MVQQAHIQLIELPDRQEIALCEAVTAVVYGKACDTLWLNLDLALEETEEDRVKANDLLWRLQSAAYAGRIKFRALKNGETHFAGHKRIDPLYFGIRRGFDWRHDQILNHELDDPVGEPKKHWHSVHLDRQEFEELLREMSISVQQMAQRTFKTGLPGRTSAKDAILELARQRFERGDVPSSLADFSRQLADELKREYPQAPSATPKTIGNHIRSLFRARQKKVNRSEEH